MENYQVSTHPLDIISTTGNLQDRLGHLHDRLLETSPNIARIACAIYDPSIDTLKTFINSTRSGNAISAYDFKLSSSPSLSSLARSKEVRVIHDINSSVKPGNKHSEWLLEQGYQSSFTVPIYDQGIFMGFVFFDSVNQDAFTLEVQRDLVLFSNLINMTLSAEFSKINSIKASALVAKEFANLRDFETGAHIERVARVTRVIAKAISHKYNLSDEFIEHVYLFSPLHDIGKIGIPDEILLKPGKLDDDEYTIMQTHVDKGVRIVEMILNDFNLKNLADSRVLLNIVGCHHEFVDGSGYPKGLSGDQIPIEAKITTVADVLDALASKRPYKSNWEMSACMREIRNMADSNKLDKDCVAAVEDNYPEILAIMDTYKDTY